MKKCHVCGVKVMGSIKRCPLCQNVLEKVEGIDEDLYPKKIEKQKDNSFIIKITGFIAFVISVISIFLNIVLPTRNLWSLIVVLVAGTVWCNVVIVMKNYKSILKCLWQQMIVVILVAMLIDWLTGKQGWSLTLVMPIIFTFAMVIMYVLSKMLRLEVGDYMIYLLSIALFGLAPIFILKSHIGLDIRFPSYVCILISIISTFGLILFEGKAILNELKRRLYM